MTAPPRAKLPPRRPAVTRTVAFEANCRTTEIMVTFGYDDRGDDRMIKEVFCADFKAGSDYHALVQDLCVLLSVLLQTGHDAKWLLAKTGGQRSLVGVLLTAMVEEEKS